MNGISKNLLINQESGGSCQKPIINADRLKKNISSNITTVFNSTESIKDGNKFNF